MEVTIYYRERPDFILNRNPFSKSEIVPVAKIRSQLRIHNDDVRYVSNAIFSFCQSNNIPWFLKEGVLLTKSGKSIVEAGGGFHSLSIGDVIELDGQKRICLPYGWAELQENEDMYSFTKA